MRPQARKRKREFGREKLADANRFSCLTTVERVSPKTPMWAGSAPDAARRPDRPVARSATDRSGKIGSLRVRDLIRR